jgi:3-oxoadipate enol-lactonase
MPFYQTPSLRINYLMEGPEGAPVVVLLNSIATDLSVWDAVASQLRDSFRVLRYDPRGHGATTSVEGPQSIAMLAHDLLALLDGLGLAQVSLCGLSLGAMVAMHIATVHPQRVHKLVLCNTAPQVGPPDGWDARAAAVREQGMAAVRPAVLTRWLSPGFCADDADGAARIVGMALRSDAAGYIGACAAIRDMDQRATIGAISAPTLVVVSTADIATAPAEGRQMAAAIAGASCVELPGGHLSNVEQAQQLATQIASFLS